MAVDRKYGRVTVEKEPGNPLGEDEPVFLLRARDKRAPQTILGYEAAARAGLQEDFADFIHETWVQFMEWQSENPDLVKDPD